jgi:hypothetical protein
MKHETSLRELKTMRCSKKTASPLVPERPILFLTPACEAEAFLLISGNEIALCAGGAIVANSHCQ